MLLYMYIERHTYIYIYIYTQGVGLREARGGQDAHVIMSLNIFIQPYINILLCKAK